MEVVTDDYAVARKRMVQRDLVERDIRDPRLLKAVLEVPRHCFVEEALVPMAYNDHALHIGEGQTISQPYIVAFMIQALELKPQSRVLEVGTGCGYQTAILAELSQWVYSMERLSGLLLKARRTLKSLHYRNITLKLGDGSLGWPQYAPYDAIIVAAASPKVPEPYLDQLVPGGRLILPLGTEESQTITLVEKTESGSQQRELLACRFVPLKGQHGFPVE